MKSEKIQYLIKIIKKIFEDNMIMSAISAVIGILTWKLIENLFQKNLTLTGFSIYFILILALFSTFIICMISQRIKGNNERLNNEIVNFILQIDNKFNKNIDVLRSEVKKAFINNFRCIFMQDQQERHNTMIDCIKNAQKCIFIFSELSSQEVTQKDTHKTYLNALRECVEKNRDNKEFNLVRIIVPPSQENDWIKGLIIKSPTYYAHFKNLNQYRETSLLEFKNGPRGVSILLIDDRYLFLRIKPEYEHNLFYHILDGGLFFDDFSSNLVNNFKYCFERDLIANSNPIKSDRLTG